MLPAALLALVTVVVDAVAVIVVRVTVGAEGCALLREGRMRRAGGAADVDVDADISGIDRCLFDLMFGQDSQLWLVLSKRCG